MRFLFVLSARKQAFWWPQKQPLADHSAHMNISDHIEDFILSISAKISQGRELLSIDGSWYLSPKQHAFEFIVINAIMVMCFLHFLRKTYSEFSILMKSKKSKMLPRRAFRVRVFSFSFFVCLCATIIYKINRYSLIFLLQPCHMNMMLLIFITEILDRDSKLAHIVFNIILHISWGTLMAIVFPDLRGYDQYLELECFWVEHILLLIIPLYCIYSERFIVMEPSSSLALVSFFIIGLYHSFILSALALIYGKNLNYVLSPPRKLILLLLFNI